jgi:TIR domain
MQYDVFICHASEDKKDFVRPLAELLKLQHIDVWYDEFSLSIGDSLTQKIDEGLSKSRFGIVVLSPNFFKKPWAKRELNGLTLREMVEKRNLILPIWHRVTVEDVAKFSPPLADKKAGTSSEGINSLVRELTTKIKPDESPLIVARNFLFELDVESPPISDEWWLDVIEYKEFLKFPDINSQKRWIFPLPFPHEDRGINRGHNIASTALQLDWSFEGEELNISPITHPEKVHEYIHRWPGLYDCARENAALLALYVPQLTIKGFDSGFEDVFDKLLASKKQSDMIFSYGSHDTVDGKPALCGDIIAYRHETFGNYEPDDLGKWYFDAHDGTYIRSHWEVFEGLVWLLSSDSNWLPEKHRQTFITGIKSRDNWIRFNNHEGHDFHLALLKKKKHQFKLTRTLKRELHKRTENAIHNLNINDDAGKITERLLSIDIINCYYDFQELLNQKRKK